jgi:hypothetical protein
LFKYFARSGTEYLRHHGLQRVNSQQFPKERLSRLKRDR